ncbi:hypothetical protein JCM10207_008835 [Rhodosporidiobolus poonsookiae]
MATLQERLDAASSFLLQSPPGEVNDVFSDIRTLVSSDADLETGILPALRQYNRDQFTVAELDGEKVLVTPVSPLVKGAADDEKSPEERHVDPRGQRSFVFDHMKVSASSPAPLPVDADTETLRSSIDTLLSSYVTNHYSECASAVYALEDPAYPPSPSLAPEPETEVEPAAEHGAGETGSLAQDVEGGEEQVADSAAETAEAAEEALPSDEGETAQGSAGEVETGEEKEEEEEEGEDDKMDVGTPAAPAEGEEVAEQKEEAALAPAAAVEEPKPKPEPKARPSRLFGLYFVGNKYNPSNYWTGRWRATYDLDYEKGTLAGKAQIQVHYYEQGNVQLATTLHSSTSLSRQPSAEEIVAAVKSSEASFQRSLSDTYAALSDEGFRELRRALPKTKSKINWEAATGMRVGKIIGGQ